MHFLECGSFFLEFHVGCYFHNLEEEELPFLWTILATIDAKYDLSSTFHLATFIPNATKNECSARDNDKVMHISGWMKDHLDCIQRCIFCLIELIQDTD